MDDREYLPLSWLSQTNYCLRRAALLLNERVWEENAETAKGRAEHKNVHTQRVERREIQSALESVGLDPNTSYLHALRPGRPSFALDLLEELRAPLCDRFTLSLFNKKQLSQQDFETDEEAVYLNDRGRRTVLTAWQRRKAEEVQHPFLNEKIQIGMIPFSQAMLFARVLRGDLDCYPPFVWR